MATLSLHIDASDAQDLSATISALAAAFGVPVTGSLSADPKPATKSSRAKAAEPATGGAAAASQPATTDPKPASGSAETGAASGASAATDTVTPEALRELAGKYAAKGGPAALAEVFIENGSPQGKFSQLPVENYPAVFARLTELLGTDAA